MGSYIDIAPTNRLCNLVYIAKLILSLIHNDIDGLYFPIWKPALRGKSLIWYPGTNIANPFCHPAVFGFHGHPFVGCFLFPWLVVHYSGISLWFRFIPFYASLWLLKYNHYLEVSFASMCPCNCWNSLLLVRCSLLYPLWFSMIMGNPYSNREWIQLSSTETKWCATHMNILLFYPTSSSVSRYSFFWFSLGELVNGFFWLTYIFLSNSWHCVFIVLETCLYHPLVLIPRLS